ncbi:TBC1 domain family member 15 [Bacillus rossius redtenbacheri]|uniref:TBC1 domain family member 15 n=1 Tax=Bacillus rossius redtenbacheri TaxID=93214 RepID=UPI002FDE782E
MSETDEQGKDLYSHHGVLVKTNHPNREEDSQCSGTLSIVDYSFGKCIEWKPTDDSVDSEMNDQEWAMVNTHGRRVRTLSECQSRPRPIRIEMSDLKSFRVTRNSQQISLMQRDGTTHSSFFFQHANADSFVGALKANVKIAKSKKDKHLYIVLDQPESRVLDRSFAELDLFTENTSDVVWKFVRNLHHRPYETTLEAFSKLTDIWLYKQPEQRLMEREVAELLNRSLTLDETEASVAGEDYAVIRIRGGPALPPRPPCPRGPPLSVDQWARCLDEEGRVPDPDRVKDIIFRGGVSASLRYEVWKFLLGYFPWGSTHAERQQLRKRRVEEYFQMKLQWRSMTPAQEQRFSDYRERKSLIEKDVYRTDRTIPFFAGDNNPNLQLLSDILMTYVMYNFDLGYVQGMSDLLSPILCLMTNEVDAFWCFVGFMDKVSSNFELDQAGIKLQLTQLFGLLGAAEPELAAYLEQHESGNMFFCFRWLLVLFKREFSHQDIMRLWEVLWTDLPCQNFHLLICVAILDTEKNILMENGYGFTEILKHINDLSLHIDLDSSLSKAEGMYRQLTAAAKLPDPVRRIVGLEPLGEPSPEPEAAANGVDGNHSCPAAAVSAATDPEDAAFERSLSFNYL